MRIDLRKFASLALLAAGLMIGMPGAASADTVCDLRVTGNQNANCSITGINTGLFYTDEQHPTGTGFIDSFVRIQQNGWEQGYNTSARPVEPNNNVKTDPNYTRNLLLSEVGTKVINNITYREFFLDVNEPAATNGNKNYITLDQLEVYVSNKASLDNYCSTGGGVLGDGGSSGTDCLSDSVKIYDMDAGAGGDGYVQLDYLVKGNGSGSSDMTFYLESSKFGNYQYVYLFSQFGDILPNDPYKYESQAGFEEWFVKSSVPPPSINAVPEPASLMLLGSGLAALAARRRRGKSTE